MNILHIDSSPRLNGDTRMLTRVIVDGLREGSPSAQVTHRDVARQAPSPISEAWMAGAHGSPEASARAAVCESDQLVEELRTADAIVIGVPMYNFLVPSTLKAWIDFVVRSGQTFTFRDGHAVGLLEDRPVYVVVSSSADYEGDGPLAPFDFLTPYLRHVLGFMGLRDVRFVRHVHAHDEAVNLERQARSASMARSLVRSDRKSGNVPILAGT